MPVFDLTSLAMNNHHAAVISYFSRMLSDQIQRQVKCELGEFHSVCIFIKLKQAGARVLTGYI